MFGVGGLFFVLQISSAIQSQADNVIIANMLGPSAVTPYAICMQLFLVIPMVMALLWAPIWPAYREALASGDSAWIKKVFLKTIGLALSVSLPASLVLVFLGQDVVRLWVGDKVIPSLWLLIGFGIWQIFLVIGNALAMLLNAVQFIKVQIIVAVSAGVSNVLITIFLINKVGVEGAIWGTVISYFFCALIPYSFLVFRLFLRLRKEEISTLSEVQRI
jgi:O-antigen/teichoic acid export membrane protein